MVSRTFVVLAFLLLATICEGSSLIFGSSTKKKRDECGFAGNPKLIRRLPKGRPVYGVQPVGKGIYVIRDSTPYIEVYDRKTLTRKGNISIASRGGPYDMVQSTQSSSLFIADWFDSQNLTVVQVNNGNLTKWSFQEQNLTTLGLAGSNKFTGSNIIVTAAVSQKLKVFGPAGNLVREVVIGNITRPRQAIQVASDRYAVCHGYGGPPELHRVCLVNVNGSIIKCYGKTSGSRVGRLNVPARLELGSRGCILVADSGNKRIVLLNRKLKYVRDLISAKSRILEGPVRLYLDRVKRRLYVADNAVNKSGIAVSGKVLVFKIK